MKVLLFNGSPHKNGCTYTALEEISKTLTEEGIESEIYQVGWGVMPCRACGACAKLGKCVINDAVNEFVDLLAGCDGLIIGSPVHYASASGGITAFMDRVFYSGFLGGHGNVFRLKPAAAVASGWYVQFGAYQDTGNARTHLNRYSRLWPGSYPAMKTVPNGGLYKLMAGPFSTKEEAILARQEMLDKGIDGFVVRK